MQISLVDFTGSGHPDPADYAATVLLFTKNTRLTMSPGLRAEIAAWPAEKKLEGLAAMAKTIPSSWEFVDYTFLVEGVSRGFTHQFVRSRHMSFAQQTMRVLNVSEGDARGWKFYTGPSVVNDEVRWALYNEAMDSADEFYKLLIETGAEIEDARGVLPTNIKTNIVAKMNMRTLVELVRKRSSIRVQGEYRDALLALRTAATDVHPWLTMFIATDAFKASQELEARILALGLPKSEAIDLIKLIDIMRTQ
jgi:flavin-dependent thymidylate synthase